MRSVINFVLQSSLLKINLYSHITYDAMRRAESEGKIFEEPQTILYLYGPLSIAVLLAAYCAVIQTYSFMHHLVLVISLIIGSNSGWYSSWVVSVSVIVAP